MLKYTLIAVGIEVSKKFVIGRERLVENCLNFSLLAYRT